MAKRQIHDGEQVFVINISAVVVSYPIDCTNPCGLGGSSRAAVRGGAAEPDAGDEPDEPLDERLPDDEPERARVDSGGVFTPPGFCNTSFCPG